jgi:hypothetical protein
MVYIPEKKKNLVLAFWCLGGEIILPQNVVDPPLEDTKIKTKGLVVIKHRLVA